MDPVIVLIGKEYIDSDRLPVISLLVPEVTYRQAQLHIIAFIGSLVLYFTFPG